MTGQNIMLPASGRTESFRAGARMQMTNHFLFKHNDKLGLKEEATRLPFNSVYSGAEASCFLQFTATWVETASSAYLNKDRAS